MPHKGAKATTYAEAWAPPPPGLEGWTPRPWVHRTARAEAGHAIRKRVPRTDHAAFVPAPDRDPIAILEAQEADRLPELIPLRHQRMAVSPFTYYRGAPAVMAFDLSGGPRTDIIVQASGDAHLSNFGLFASPERTLVFDANDFDETLPGTVGVGRQAARDQLRHRRPRERVRPGAMPGRRDGHGPRLPGGDGDHLQLDVPARDLVRPDQRCRHHRPRGADDRIDQGQDGGDGPSWRRSSARRGDGTGSRPSTSSPRWSTGTG